MKPSKMKTTLSLLLAITLFSTAHALPEDSSLPIQITADTGGYDQKLNEGFYDSNVVMVQGTLEIRADHAIFTMVDDELDKVVANGKLIKIKYLPEQDKPWVFGEGEILEYFPKKNLLILKQKAKLTQDTDIVEANAIEYDTLNKKVKALSGKDKSDRVFFEIKPKGK
ncbi:lipopolysaccharide transport periplasmic protein LptA [Wohlfahrtiimonas larvae]|uniref:Organic solvent tolerance-like N-terminal domain-containing protein n=1 Tax=Wohlfahrtiimonas larvae TaxID=1157986 RepID=A0ABP9MDA5_9GAMM|nr:lipopolysaccharide transport periplasmic protein LptA [Wohlfahrtiimonas larvae]